MNRLDRLQAILIHLQSKKTVTAQEIADRFEISIRTVYRDIRSLEEAGVPIGAEAGIGYFLTDNYHLPPVMFTDQEASALLFGAKFTEQLSDKNIRTSYESALFKIKSVLRAQEKEQLETLHQHINVYGYHNDSQSDLYLQEIQKSLINNSKLEIKYFAAYSQDHSTRRIVPLGLCFYGLQWHLIAFCELRNSYRDFRLDRIQALEFTDISFDRSDYLNMEQYFETVKAKENMTSIVLHINETLANLIKDSKYWYGYTHQTKKDDGFEMHFLNNDLNGFARWVICAGRTVKVIEPPELTAIIIDKVKELQDWYL